MLSLSATIVVWRTRRSPRSEVRSGEGEVSMKMGVHSSQDRASYSTFNRSSRSSEMTPCNTK